MFGIGKLKEHVLELEDKVALLAGEIKDNTRALNSFADRGASIIKYEIDAKSDLSAIKHQMQMIEAEIAEIQVTMEKYENVFDAFLASRYEKDDANNAILGEFIAKQNIIFDYMQSLEELLETTESIMEELKPEKKVPKLPKSETATN